MSTLKMASYDSYGNLYATAELVIAVPYIPSVSYLYWYLDPKQPQDNFDFTTGVSGITWFNRWPSPNGWGAPVVDPNTGVVTLYMYFGTGLANFANLYDVGDQTFKTDGQGWLYRGKRFPSGGFSWNVV